MLHWEETGEGGPTMEKVDRQDQELREEAWLSDDAAHSRSTAGRLHGLVPDALRTDYQRDRDRIIHSKAFRRLSHKTQVFIAPEGDHYRTRLTHTLEVAQIARDSARALSLNEDLTEAIALGHDLGHTPFGHTGERALGKAMALHRGLEPTQETCRAMFRHNVQGVRTAQFLEHGGRGLDLTQEVLDGILCHTGKRRARTLEGRVVAVADRIAYVNHDIDDALRAGLLAPEDLPAGPVALLGPTPAARIGTLVNDLVETSAALGDVRLSPRAWAALDALRNYLFRHVYLTSDAKREDPKASLLVMELFDYYIDHLDEVPQEYRLHGGDSPARQVADFIAGMTDRFALHTFERLRIPRSWHGERPFQDIYDG